MKPQVLHAVRFVKRERERSKREERREKLNEYRMPVAVVNPNGITISD
jgi:hypothetical protein